MYLGFEDLLIYGTPVITLVLTYLLLRGGEGKGLRIVKNLGMLHFVHYSLLFSLFLVTIYSVYMGSRPFIYFLIVAALFVTSVLYGVNSSEKVFPRILFLTVLILAFSVLVAVFVGNDFYPFRGFEREPILQAGSIEAYQYGSMKEGLYYYIPIDTLIGGSVALITGQTIITPLLYKSFLLIGVIMGLISLLRRMSHNTVTGIIGAFFFISIPSLTFIGRTSGLAFGVFYIFITLLLYESPRATVISLFIVTLPMIFSYPSGFVIIIAILLPLALLGINNWPKQGTSSRRIRLSVLTMIVVTFTYWTYTYLMSLMAKMGISLYSTIFSYFEGTTAEVSVVQGYVPRYYYSGFEIFAYAWAIPVALSAALLISLIFQFIRKKKLDPSQSLIIVSAFAGSSIVFFAYLFSGGETGQYLITVGYFILLLSSSIAATKLLTNIGKNYAVIAMVLLSFFIFTGAYSPDWAPLEHTNFETAATIHPYHTYLEAETVNSLIPKNATVYGDYDLPISIGVYKPIRQIILQIQSGADPTQFARPPITLYGIRDERFKEIALEDWDVVYSSGYHRIIAVELDQ